MKKTILLLTALLFTGINAQGKFYTEEYSTRVYPLKDLSSSGAPEHSYDVLNYKMNLDLYNCYISPYPNSFSGYVEVHFRADSVISEISLNAGSNFIVIDSVNLAGLSYTHLNDILKIMLDGTYDPGDTASVRIYYHHLDLFDNAFFAANGFVFTNVPPEFARNWFPCWDKPADKATLDLTAKVPSSVKLGSNGRLEDSVMTGDTIYYRWVSRDPIATYLMVISSKVNYNLDIIYWVKPGTNDTIPVRFYWNPGENQAALQHIKDITPPMMTHFSELFGDYPFEKHGFATLNNQFTFAGMEHQTLISLCPNCWNEILAAHEFAHQWFGDLISPATWADVWLNEGFASYCEALWYEYTLGYTAYKAAVDGHKGAYLGGNPGLPIYNPSWAVTTPPINLLYNYAIIYAKGSVVLHMLRMVLGDSLFFSALKTFAQHPDLKYKNAYTSDMVQIFNDATGQNLDWFFDQWVYGPNHPDYQNTYAIDSLASGIWKIVLNVKQIQTNAAFFKMPVKISVNFSDGTDTSFVIKSEINNEVFEFNFSKKPDELLFDPDRDILKVGNTVIVSVNEVKKNVLKYVLHQNYPNPFNPSTVMSASVPERSTVRLFVYNPLGEIIHSFEETNITAGTFEYRWDASGFPSGVYFYRAEIYPDNGGENFISTKKMILVR